jgi:predicted metal-dependent enzyme (double-stranded beta helix superfamily)
MMNGETWQDVVASRYEDLSSAPASRPPIPARQRFLWDAARVVRSGASRVDAAVADLLASTVADPEFLQGIALPSAAQNYARTAIFNTDSYCVLAIVWRPGQMSPVHSHRAWCALGVHSGTLTETHFEPVADALEHGLRVAGCRQLHAGSTSHGAANDHSAHRMANLGIEPAISIHVYGTAFDMLGSGLNQIWAA